MNLNVFGTVHILYLLITLSLSAAGLFGKKDNAVYHFVWALGLTGAGLTISYPTLAGMLIKALKKQLERKKALDDQTL